MLIKNEVDIVFSILYDFEGKHYDNLEWIKVGDTPHCACVLKTCPLASRCELTPEDLRDMDFISISPRVLSEYNRMLMDIFRAKGFIPEVTRYVEASNSQFLNLMTEEDVFICDEYYLDMNENDHARIPIKGTHSGFVMAWRKGNTKRAVKELINIIKNM